MKVAGPGAELLLAVAAGRAGAAGVDQAAHRREVALLEPAHVATHRDDAADDLVTRDARVDRRHGAVPLVADLVQVRVADAAEEDLELHVVSAPARGAGW